MKAKRSTPSTSTVPKSRPRRSANSTTKDNATSANAGDDAAWDDVIGDVADKVTQHGIGDVADKITQHGIAEATYKYHDENGELLFGVDRYADKSFRQWQPESGAPLGRRYKLDGVRRVLYRLPEVIDAVKRGEPIYIVEGEKDADALAALGLTATCNAGGAGKWIHKQADPPYREFLRGADVRIIHDKDTEPYPGQRHGVAVAEDLASVASSVTVLEALEGKDASDHLDAGYGLEDLVTVAEPEEVSSGAYGPHRYPAKTRERSALPKGQAAAVVGDEVPAYVDAILSKLDGVRRVADDQWEALCPVETHGDTRPSFGVGIGTEGRLLLHCQASAVDERCDLEYGIMPALGIGWPDLHPPRTSFDARVADALDNLRVRETARKLLHEEQERSSFEEPPSRKTLADELSIDDPPQEYTVAELHPTGANSLLGAQFKAGKTTLFINLLRSLLDGVPFLDAYAITPPEGRVAFWNYELSERQFRAWLRSAGIKNVERGTVLNLRGYRVPFTAGFGEDWAVKWLAEREVTAWVVDPFARAFGGGSENDNSEVGAFLEAVDVVKRRAGVADLFMAAHTGRGEQIEGDERVRGATRLDDWADVRWLLTRADESRFFRAEGRDVYAPEVKLGHDSETHRLYIVGGSRFEERSRERIHEVVSAVAASPGLGTRELLAELTGEKKTRPRWIADAKTQGLIRVKVEGQKHLHYVTDAGRELAEGQVKKP